MCKRTSLDDDEHLLPTLIIKKNIYNKELFGNEKEILLLKINNEKNTKYINIDERII